MAIETSDSEALEHLGALMDRAVNDRETIIITREGGARVALIAAEKLAGYEETAHLPRSPENARRLLEALRESLTDEVELFDPADLRDRLAQADDGHVVPTLGGPDEDALIRARWAGLGRRIDGPAFVEGLLRGEAEGTHRGLSDS